MKGAAVNEFCNMKFVSDITFSPEGREMCFVMSEADEDRNKYNSFIYKRDGKEMIQLTAGGKESSFVFLDEKTILFPGDRDESKEKSAESKYYKISLNGGEAKKAYTFPIPVSKVEVLENGNLILTGTTFPGFEDLYKGDKKLSREYLEYRKENEDYEVVEENPWWWNGSTFTRGAYDSLFYYDGKKKKLSRLTEAGFSVGMSQLTPDKKHIYFWGQENVTHPSFENMNLYKLELLTGEKKLLFEGSRELFVYSMALGENFGLLMLSEGRHMGMNSNPDFYKLDYASDEISFYAKCGEAIGSSVGSDSRRGGGKSVKMSGDILYFICTKYDGAYLYKLENGEISIVSEKEGAVDSFDTNGTEIIVSALWDMKCPELYDISGKQITHFNDRVLRGKYTAIPEECNVICNGEEIHGFVLKPMNFDPEKKYPVILDIHGGPKTVYGKVYYHEMQYWAGKGYFVIFCNPHGSDGRGDDFANICGKYGSIDYEDIMAFTDHALEKYPQMDKDRLFETGGSYGGFMTNWIIGHTDRFRAAATQRSIVNWFSFFGVSDIGIDFTEDQNKSTPWENPEKLWSHSPMKYLDKCKTPTLVLHSMEDYRCPVDQGYQLYSSLLSLGVETKMVLFKGENHDLSRTGKPKHRIRRLREITKWFESHM